MMQETWKKPEGKWDCRIIFSDIDGTLLNNRHQVPAKTREKILELEQREIPFILLSARMPDGVYTIQKELGSRSPIVCYSGGLILDENGKQLYSRQLPLKQAAEVKEILKEAYPGICCNTYGMNRWVVDDDKNPWVMREEGITQGKAAVGDIREFFAQDGGIHKFLLMGKAEEITGAAELLNTVCPGLTIQRSNANYLEVMEGSVKKSSGVHFLCSHYGISEAQAAAFGDGENDIDMIQAVGYGFAMENAPENVKRQARYITLSNEEEGILHVIQDL